MHSLSHPPHLLLASLLLSTANFRWWVGNVSGRMYNADSQMCCASWIVWFSLPIWGSYMCDCCCRWTLISSIDVKRIEYEQLLRKTARFWPAVAAERVITLPVAHWNDIFPPIMLLLSPPLPPPLCLFSHYPSRVLLPSVPSMGNLSKWIIHHISQSPTQMILGHPHLDSCGS